MNTVKIFVIFSPWVLKRNCILDKVLAVQEKSGKFRGSGVWKFPTGVVDPVGLLRKSTIILLYSLPIFIKFFLCHQGEDISAGAVREVKEETGVCSKLLPKRTYLLDFLLISISNERNMANTILRLAD